MYKAFILILYVILSGLMYIFLYINPDNMIIARIYIRNIGDFKELLVMCLC